MPEHIMARGALSPDFSAVDIDCHSYWDGGLFSNTPLQFVMVNLGTEQVCIFRSTCLARKADSPKTLPMSRNERKTHVFPAGRA